MQVYTSFGYDGAGLCRRIKDELVEAFEKEGSSWDEVVQKAVGELSWKVKGKAPVDDAVDMTIGQLIVEAEELKSLLDRLGQKMDIEERARHDSVIPAVS